MRVILLFVLHHHIYSWHTFYLQLVKAWNINTALDLSRCNLDWIRKQTNSLGFQTVQELNGLKCFGLDMNPEPKKTIVSSRSFGEAITDLEDINHAVATHASRLGEKLRNQNSLASNISVFIMTNRFSTDKSSSYFRTQSMTIEPTNYTPDLIQAALKVLENSWKHEQINQIVSSGNLFLVSKFKYIKCGVYVFGLKPEDLDQTNQDIFADQKAKTRRQTKTRLMQKFDLINNRYGRYSLKSAALGSSQKWQMKSNQRSKRYTTEWSELLNVE
jgi:DNA polymerase V